jgi:Protein of unknown function (DUF2541)
MRRKDFPHSQVKSAFSGLKQAFLGYGTLISIVFAYILKLRIMKNQLVKIAGVFVLAFLIAGYSAMAQNNLTWDKIGTETVDYTIDHDVVSLNKSQQTYTALKIKVLNGTLNVHKATVHFTNGDKQDVDLPEVLGKDNDGKLIDLAGNKRLIEKVTFWYDTKNENNEKATVEVWARK